MFYGLPLFSFAGHGTTHAAGQAGTPTVHGAALFCYGMCVVLVAVIWRGNSHHREVKPRKWWISWIEMIPGINEKQPRKIDPITGKPYPKWVRGAAVMSACAGFFLVLAFTPWGDALVFWTYRGWGPGILALAFIGLLGGVWLEVRHLHNYQLVATTFTSFAFGTVAATAWVLKDRLTRKGSDVPGGVTAAIHDYSRRASSGASIRAYHHTATVAGVPWIAIGGFAAIAVAVVLILNLHRHTPKAVKRWKAYSEQAALAGAAARQALPSGAGDPYAQPVPRSGRAGAGMGGGR